jgi:hypothetical protein
VITGLDGKTYPRPEPSTEIMSTLQRLMPRATFSATSLGLPDDLTYEGWVYYGKALTVFAGDTR